jgi:endo-1,4-beta-xylanase
LALASDEAAPAPAAKPGDLPSLKRLGAEKGLLVGTCYSGRGDSRYQDLIRHQAAIVTPEWCLKPKFLKPSEEGPYRFAEADAIYDFCRRSGLAMHGHTLFWHHQPLDWADSADLAVALRKYGRFIGDVMARFPETQSWDVLNEIIADQGPGLLRDVQPLTRHGDAFVDLLFQTCRELAPRAKLVLNDYNLECGAKWCAAKQRRMLAFASGLVRRKVPIDAVGIQSHLSSKHGLGIPETLEFIERIADLGLEVHISELDVNDVAFADDTATRDTQVAAFFRDYLTALLESRAVKRVVFWGLSDHDHWMVRGDAEDIRPGGAGRPALFDKQLKPKPSFFAVADALKLAPSR